MHVRTTFFCILAAVLIFSCGSAFAQQNRKLGVPQNNNAVKYPDQADKAFLKQAAVGGAAEIQLGQMAEKKASNPQVKQFGARMVKDHSKNADLLTQVAQSQNVSLPTRLTPKYQNAQSQLSREAGPQFDSAYMKMMVQDHMKTVAKFKKEAATSQDPTVKKYAQESLPVLESHLQEARQIASQLKQGAK